VGDKWNFPELKYVKYISFFPLFPLHYFLKWIVVNRRVDQTNALGPFGLSNRLLEWNDYFYKIVIIVFHRPPPPPKKKRFFLILFYFNHWTFKILFENIELLWVAAPPPRFFFLLVGHPQQLNVFLFIKIIIIIFGRKKIILSFLVILIKFQVRHIFYHQTKWWE
jgi:hypothetical protein